MFRVRNKIIIIIIIKRKKKKDVLNLFGIYLTALMNYINR